ncbi:MAG: tetratricopeptide repeat protein [Gammaproteobacteria bacterium]
MSLALFWVVLCAPGCQSDADGEALFRAGRFDGAHDSLARAADEGDARALLCLGVMYQLGLGVSRDPAHAASWYERGALAGDRAAQFNLGLLYLNGEGVTRNHEAAFGWLQASMERGHTRAQHYLAMLTDKLTPNQMVRAREAVRKRVRDEVR